MLIRFIIDFFGLNKYVITKHSLKSPNIQLVYRNRLSFMKEENWRYLNLLRSTKEEVFLTKLLNQLVDYQTVMKDKKRLIIVRKFLKIKFKFLTLTFSKNLIINISFIKNLKLLLIVLVKHNTIYLTLQKLILYNMMCSAKEAVHT